jgi:hypothetical protein
MLRVNRRGCDGTRPVRFTRHVSRLPALTLLLTLAVGLLSAPVARADAAFQTLPFAQDWSNTGLIINNDDWSGVPGVVGYLGSDLTSAIGADPQTVLGDGAGTVDVIANQTNPNTLSTGGVAEFEIANPVVALNGSGTADAPFVLLNLNTTGQENVTVSYTLRDLDSSADDAVQQVALQYRVGTTGNFTNVPAGYVADATEGPSLAGKETPVSAVLPAAVANQAQAQIRIITTNAAGNDEWVGIDNVNITGTPFAGDTAPSVTGTTPADGATGVEANANLTVTFSEPVNLGGAWFSIACATSGARTVADTAVSGGPTTFTIDPNADFVAGESCTVTIDAAQVTDQDTNDPPDTLTVNVTFSFTVGAVVACAANDTPIHAVQGSGNTAATTGNVTVQGVVVGDYEFLGAGAPAILRGFYLQELTPDADPATSEGIFVFNANNNSVSLGQVVQVTGTAGEFQDQTQISASAIENCGSTATAPTVDVTLPFPADVGGVPFLERFEGMLVKLPQKLFVTEHFQLGRFGQIIMSSGDRLYQPTNLVSPGGPGSPREQLQQANDLNRIIIDDELQNQNPDPIKFGRGGAPLSAANTLRGGDTATGIVGVMTYTWAGNSASPNAYRVRPIGDLSDLTPEGGAPIFEAANLRPNNPADAGGSLKVSAFNVLNYFNTFGTRGQLFCNAGVGGAALECRGAENQAEFDRQWPKTVDAILGLDSDIIGLIEMENDGYGSDSAIQDLVNRLNAETAPGTYAFIDADAGAGQVNVLGNDAIKVAMIYRTATVTPVGQTAVLNTGAFGEFPRTNDTPIQRNRPPLAQAFEEQATGGRVIVAINHLKSKGSGCEDNAANSLAPNDIDTGDGQGNCNQTRNVAAQELVDWLATDPTGTGEQDILITGDLNAYALEDPVTTIKNAGYTDIIKQRLGDDAYSFAFSGQWGYLDHVLASNSMTGQIAGVTEWHINADEPNVLDYNTNFKSAGQLTSLYAPDQFRAADHDPVIVGLNLAAENKPPVAQDDIATAPYLGSATINVLANDSDPENDSLTVTEVTTPSKGTATINSDGTIAYAHTVAQPLGTVVTDTFQYTLSDGKGGAATASVTVTITRLLECATLDDFNRRDGRINSGGKPWFGPEGLGGYTIRSRQAQVVGGGPIYWRGPAYGPDQLACVTLTKIDPAGEFQTLTLKAQGAQPNWRNGVITVNYIAASGIVRIDTFQPNNAGPFDGFRHYAPIPVTFADGDVFAALALSDGKVQVFKNGLLIGTTDTTGPSLATDGAPTFSGNGTFFVNKGGRIGVWYTQSGQARFDNFGGGNVTP